ncbi:MAG TPA: hypothetical protein DDW52_27205 [Planctomycetaceae bacterium]|nr:hypothetical protein [Planctomycetaceae bacterium]
MPSAWSFENGLATTDWADWSAEVQPVDATQPTRLKAPGHSDWQIFGIEPQPRHALEIEEAYGRQDDLIVQYQQSPQDSYRFHLYWRKLPVSPASQLGIELWLGVQTGLLDSRPELHVTCHAGQAWETLKHGELVEAEPSESLAALIARRDDATGVWLIEPSDQVDVTLLSSGAESTVGVFDHFMEKGVIRRARMRFHILSADVEIGQIAELYRSFAASQLPLTA